MCWQWDGQDVQVMVGVWVPSWWEEGKGNTQTFQTMQNKGKTRGFPVAPQEQNQVMLGTTHIF